MKAGKLRIIAVSSDKRQEGIAAPTLKEEGIDVELFNWRGVFAPPGVNDTQRKAMIALMEKMTATPQWAEACKMRDWIPIALFGDGLFALDPHLDEALRREGLAREVVNRVQRIRKEAGYLYTDRIALWIDGDVPVPEVQQVADGVAVTEHPGPDRIFRVAGSRF